MIAGPNGSGKSTLTDDLRKNYPLHFGFYINADEIEKILKQNGKFGFRRYKLSVTTSDFTSFFKAHALNDKCGPISFEIKRNTFYLATPLLNFSYFSTIFADFCRHCLIKEQHSFTFETVMSGHDKIDLLFYARKKGYRIYLYFICTDDVVINKDRVANRVQLGGHNVPVNKIEERYKRSLRNLNEAIEFSDRAYLFDNSGRSHKLICEVTSGRTVTYYSEKIPNWIIQYFSKK
jgi:predicted ABC-type ATPase